MNDENKKLNVAEEIKKAHQAYKDAETLFASGSLEGATSRAYYGAFHMAQAILLTLGLEPKTHQGVARLFSLHFVKAEIIEPKYSQILARAQKYREEADYRHAMIFTPEQTKHMLQEVRGFIEEIERYLRSEGYHISA